MDRIDGRPVYSATDLVAFLACEHLTQLERAAQAGLVERPIRDDPELDIIRKRGFEHEKRFLADLSAQGRSAVTIELDGSATDRGEELRAAAASTVEAMAAGADVIYQATFFDGTFRGHADFLLRVDSAERPSRWGPYHYEVADTKLARHVKASAVLQICSYVDQLERIQGVRPELLHVALGGSARAVERLRVDDYMAYYRSARDRFLLALADEPPTVYPPTDSYPEPVEHCAVCRWDAVCSARRRADDHLSLVAGISARQRGALRERGVATLEALGELAAADGAAARGDERGRPPPGPRAGPHPARGAARAVAAIRAPPAAGRRADPGGARAGHPAATLAGRPLLRHRRRPVRVRRRARLPLRRPRDGRHVPRDLVAGRDRRLLAAGGAACLRAPDRLHHGAAGARPRAPRLPLRRRTSRPPSSA